METELQFQKRLDSADWIEREMILAGVEEDHIPLLKKACIKAEEAGLKYKAMIGLYMIGKRGTEAGLDLSILDKRG